MQFRALYAWLLAQHLEHHNYITSIVWNLFWTLEWNNLHPYLFVIKIPGEGGGSRRGGGRVSVANWESLGWWGGGLNIFFRGRNVLQGNHLHPYLFPNWSPVPNISTLAVLIRPGKSSQNARSGSPEWISRNLGISILFSRKPWISQNFPAFLWRGFLGFPNRVFGGRWSWYVGQRWRIDDVTIFCPMGQLPMFVCCVCAYALLCCPLPHPGREDGHPLIPQL